MSAFAYVASRIAAVLLIAFAFAAFAVKFDADEGQLLRSLETREEVIAYMESERLGSYWEYAGAIAGVAGVFVAAIEGIAYACRVIWQASFGDHSPDAPASHLP